MEDYQKEYRKNMTDEQKQKYKKYKVNNEQKQKYRKNLTDEQNQKYKDHEKNIEKTWPMNKNKKIEIIKKNIEKT